MKKFTFRPKHIMIFVACFYAVTAALAVDMFDTGDKLLLKAQVQDLQESSTVNNSNRAVITGNVEEPAAQEEPMPEEDDEDPVEEEIPEEEPVKEEPEEEPVYEEPAEEEPEGPVYYSFTTTNSDTGLNVRKKPALNAKRVKQLDPGDTGYIVEMGDEWSYIYAPKYDIYGYCANEFLELSEITEEDFPADLIGMTGPEDLSAVSQDGLSGVSQDELPSGSQQEATEVSQDGLPENTGGDLSEQQ